MCVHICIKISYLYMPKSDPWLTDIHIYIQPFRNFPKTLALIDISPRSCFLPKKVTLHK